jgi:hypothetical protein
MWLAFLGFLKGVSLKTWLVLGLIAAILTYHFTKIHQAKDLVREEMQTEFDNRVKDATIKALAEHIKTQSVLADLGIQEKIDFDQDLAAIRRDVSSLKAEYRQNAQKDPVDPVCYLAPWRVQAINRALGHEDGADPGPVR